MGSLLVYSRSCSFCPADAHFYIPVIAYGCMYRCIAVSLYLAWLCCSKGSKSHAAQLCHVEDYQDRRLSGTGVGHGQERGLWSGPWTFYIRTKIFRMRIRRIPRWQDPEKGSLSGASRSAWKQAVASFILSKCGNPIFSPFYF